MAKYVIEKRFSQFSRPRSRDRVSQLLAYAGVETPPEIWLGSRILLIILFGMVGFLLPFSAIQLFKIEVPFFRTATLADQFVLGIVLGLAFSLLSLLLIYLHLYYLIADRTKRVDKVLPDFLLMVAANLRSGMTPFAAFQAAARPEFGPLQTEINYVSSRSLGSESFTDAMRELTVTIDSAILRRMVGFFENELRSGGRLAYLLETSAEEIRETEEMRRQMLVTTKSYAIFLAFILLFGLPLLLAISTQFLTIFAKFEANLSEGASGGSSAGGSLGALAAPKLKIDVKFIEQAGFITIAGTCLLTSLLIGIIMEGRLLYGLKYFPPFAIASTLLFFFFKGVIGGFVGALL
jgi:flagellar protein FlaJ